ncbi:tetratricopeptide repeat protein [Paenibacillus sp. FA6]|uniref:tetratricopeptide repeat protein n=1 Tax=Paenibacillus sp. FA6 TaxID=3413029 RepID=UPI003F65EB88
MLMKHFKIITLSFLLVLVVGCGNQKEITELTTVADKYLESGEYDNSILSYNKVLELEELPAIREKIKDAEKKRTDSQIQIVKDYRAQGKLNDSIEVLQKILNNEENKDARQLLSDINKEKVAVEKSKSFKGKLDQIVKYYLQDSAYISPIKIQEANNIIREAITIIESIDSGDTSIHLYVKDMKDSYEYGSVKRFSESTMTDDAQLSETFGFMDAGMSKLNEVSGEYFIQLIGVDIKKMNNKVIPSKYSN